MSCKLSALEAEDYERIQKALSEYREMTIDPVRTIVLASRAYRASGKWGDAAEEELRPAKEIWSRRENARAQLQTMLRERETYQALVFAEERELFETAVRAQSERYRRYYVALNSGWEEAIRLLRSDASSPYRRRDILLRRQDELLEIQRMMKEVQSQK